MTDSQILTEALCLAYKNNEPTGLLWRALFRSLDIPERYLDDLQIEASDY